MKSFEILTLKDSEKWRELLVQLPLEQRDVYFTPEYYRLYEELGDGQAECFVFKKDNDIALYPFLINSINELGFDLDRVCYDIQGVYGYNGIVTSTYNDLFINDFYESFKKHCREKNIIAEFTRFHPLLKNNKFSQGNLEVIFDRKTMYIDLRNSIEHIFGKFQGGTQRQIKRAINRYQIEVKCFENNKEQLDVFMDIYKKTMKRVQSISYLYFNKPYFDSLVKNTQNVYFIAYHENNPIASTLAIYDEYYFHGHLGGALAEYLKMSPYSLLYAEMIKFGKAKGCFYFHAGGGATNKEDDPLLKFKLNFSDSLADFFIGKYIHNEQIYEEVIRQWSQRFPEKVAVYENLLLKYRY